MRTLAGPTPQPEVMTTSVIIPTYNCAEFVGEAIESVLSQKMPVEVIVINDGSTDDTRALLDVISDPRVLVVHTEKRGLSAARNEGLMRATGEYIAFLDADDRWLPGKLAASIRVLEVSPWTVAVFTNFRRFDTSGYRPGTQFDYYPEIAGIPRVHLGDEAYSICAWNAFVELVQWGEWPTWVQTLTFRAGAIRDLSFVSAQDGRGWVFAEDTHFVMLAFRRGAAAYIAEPLVEVRRHQGNTMRTRALPLARIQLNTLRRIRADMRRMTTEERQAINRRIRRAWRGWIMGILPGRS